MNINPKLTEEIAKVSVDLKNTAKDLVTKQEVGNRLQGETPKGLCAGYFHPDIIKKTSEDFDIKKAIEEFHDINDTETVEKICDCWREEYAKLLETFSPENVKQMLNPKARHQKAIIAIEEKYKGFTDKIGDMAMGEDEVASKKAREVFATHVEPITQLSMETYSKIDQLPAMRSAYKTHNMHEITELKNKINKADNLEELQSLMMDIENIKDKDPHEYEKISKIIEKRIEELVEKSSPTESAISEATNVAEESKKSVMQYAKMNASDLGAEIEKMTMEEMLAGEKVGKIYDVLDKLRLSGDTSYTKLKSAFDKKLTDLAGMM